MRIRGMGACVNTDAQGIGTDDATGETCVKAPGETIVNVPASSTGQTFTQWLNANQKTVLIVGAGFFGLMLFARAGR